MKRTLLPSAERLKEVFDYYPSTGLLKWKIQPRGRGKIGEAAGGLTRAGYRQVVIDRVHYLAHRIIWKIQTGLEPPLLIDHRDGDNSNDRWKNLRNASPTGNSCNSKRRSDNTSCVKGISYDGARKKWRAYVIVHHRQHDLGRFNCFGIAVKSMRAARIDLHGDFARAA